MYLYIYVYSNEYKQSGVNEEDVETFLTSLFSSSNLCLPHSTSMSDNGERNRGGEKENKIEYVSERTMDILLRELRKLDRDRDRVLHPVQIKSLFTKYKVKSITKLLLILTCNIFITATFLAK